MALSFITTNTVTSTSRRVQDVKIMYLRRRGMPPRGTSGQPACTSITSSVKAGRAIGWNIQLLCDQHNWKKVVVIPCESGQVQTQLQEPFLARGELKEFATTHDEVGRLCAYQSSRFSTVNHLLDLRLQDITPTMFTGVNSSPKFETMLQASR